MTSLIVSIPDWCAADTAFGLSLQQSGPPGLGVSVLSSLGSAFTLVSVRNSSSVSSTAIDASQYNLTSLAGFNSTRNANVTVSSSQLIVSGVPVGTVLAAVIQPFGSIKLVNAGTGQELVDGGTFAGWSTSNGIYTGMMYLSGDMCPATGKDRRTSVIFKCGGSAGALSVNNITADALGCDITAELSTINACGINLNVSTQTVPCSSSSSSSTTPTVLDPIATVDSKSVASARMSGPQSLQGVAADAKAWTATNSLVSQQGPVPTLPASLAAFNGLEFNVAVMPNANGSSLLSTAAINGLPAGSNSINADGTVALSLSLPPFGRAQLLNPDGTPSAGGNFGTFVSWIVSGPRYSGQVFAGGDVCPGYNISRAARLGLM
jgi:hypothetical protein